MSLGADGVANFIALHARNLGQDVQLQREQNPDPKGRVSAKWKPVFP